MVAANRSCYCIDTRLKPTLFPHPATCMCSNDPYPPKDEKYRYCKLKMKGQTIGEVMEEVILDHIPPPPPPPIPKGERLMKKIMRSAYIPDELDLEDENACIECLARDPLLLKKVMESIHFNKDLNMKNVDSDPVTCREPRECRNPHTGVEQLNCFDENFKQSHSAARNRRKCKWRDDGAICTCKQAKTCTCASCDQYLCKCEKNCMRCTCQKPLKPETPRPQETVEECIQQNIPITETLEQKSTTVNYESTIEEPLLTSPRGKTAKKSKKAKPTSLKKSPKKSPTRKWNRPNIICERSEISGANPFCHPKESENNQREIPSVEFYEHFHNLRPVKSSKSAFRSDEPSERPSSVKPKPSTIHRASTVSSHSSAKNRKKARLKQMGPSKIPWNFNNQPKKEDPMKGWGNVKYSWSKKLNYSDLARKIEMGSDSFMRSRGGDDLGNQSDNKTPEYFEYKQNLQVESDKSDDLLRRKEQKRHMKELGKKRVKDWHEALEENARRASQSEDIEDATQSTEQSRDQEKYKRKIFFSEDDTNNEVQDKPSEISSQVVERFNEEREDEAISEHRLRRQNMGHDQKQCLQCLMNDVQQQYLGSMLTVKHSCDPEKNDDFKDRKIERNLKLKQTKTVILNEHPHIYNYKEDQDEGDQPEIERKFGNLPTILEERPRTYETNRERNSTYRASEYDGYENEATGDMNQNSLRSKSADGTTSIEKPFFNVIKQKIHSRNKTLEDLEKFRDEHFFETHSTKSYLQNIPEHTCVHRFTIDERLYPEPLHTDASGTSCCIHCDKPMKNEKTIFLDQRESGENVGNKQIVQKQISKFSLRPKPVHIGSKNSVMEIKLKPEHEDLLKNENIEKKRRVFYPNSLALRQQKR
ncbi:hypothetical protein HHI36_021890 [Cryptolaemus montrouzieri]